MHARTCASYSSAIRLLTDAVSRSSCSAWPTNSAGSWDSMARKPALARGTEKCSRRDSSTTSSPGSTGTAAAEEPGQEVVCRHSARMRRVGVRWER